MVYFRNTSKGLILWCMNCIAYLRGELFFRESSHVTKKVCRGTRSFKNNEDR